MGAGAGVKAGAGGLAGAPRQEGGAAADGTETREGRARGWSGFEARCGDRIAKDRTCQLQSSFGALQLALAFDPANGGQDVGRLDVGNWQSANRAVENRKKVFAALCRGGCSSPRAIILALFAELGSQ